MSKQQSILVAGLATLFVVGLLAGLLSPVIFHFATRDELRGITVDRNGERVCSSGTSDCRYLEFASGEVFENTDTMLAWKFNSSDVHASMRAGRTCDVTVTGWRVPFLSWYRNIIEARCA